MDARRCICEATRKEPEWVSTSRGGKSWKRWYAGDRGGRARECRGMLYIWWMRQLNPPTLGPVITTYSGLPIHPPRPTNATNSNSSLWSQASSDDCKGPIRQVLSGGTESVDSACIMESAANYLGFGNDRTDGISIGTVDQGERRTREASPLQNSPDGTMLSTSPAEAFDHAAEDCGVTPAQIL